LDEASVPRASAALSREEASMLDEPLSCAEFDTSLANEASSGMGAPPLSAAGSVPEHAKRQTESVAVPTAAQRSTPRFERILQE
jgi:hypothetical protein